MRGKKYDDYSKNCGFGDENTHSPAFKAFKIVIILAIVTVLIIVVFFCILSYLQTKPESLSEEDKIVMTSNTEQSNNMLVTIYGTANQLEADYVPELTEINGVKVNTLMSENLSLMIEKAKEDGVNLVPVEGYVSFDDQQERHDKLIAYYREEKGFTQVKAEAQAKKTEPCGGCSEKQTGLLVSFSKDLQNFENSDEFSWLDYNAVNYGFILRYDGSESSSQQRNAALYRYVGVENAKKMRMLNMCLEEYANYLSYR